MHSNHTGHNALQRAPLGAWLFLPAAALVAAAGCGAGAPLSHTSGSALMFNSTATAASVPDLDDLPLDSAATLEDYLRYAALHSAGLEAAFNQWHAALERVPQAQSLPDPRFNYRYFIEHVETRVGPQRQKLGLSQTFPWFGKLRLRGDVAMAAADATKARYDAVKLQLFRRVKNHYYEYYYLSQAIRVVDDNRKLVEYLEQVARTRYKTDAAGHPDVIRAQVELGKLADRLASLRDLTSPMAAQMNAAIGRPTDAPVATPVEIGQRGQTVDDAQLFQWLRQANPKLMELQHEMAQRRRSVRLARRDYYPDVTVGVDYIDTGEAEMTGVPDSGKDPVTVGISINLPIWRSRLDAGVSEQIARFGAASKQHIDQQSLLEAELKMAMYRLRDADRKIDLYHDTLAPKARQALKATEAAFRAGSTDFSDVVDAQRLLLEFELAYERSLTDRAQHLAEIEMLVGRELSAANDAQDSDQS